MKENDPEHGHTALPLIAHIVYRFDYGGLENGIVNLINALQGQSLRHCVIALAGATEFRERLNSPDVAIYDLGKKSGKDFGAYFRLYRLLRKLRPAVVHSRNIGTLDCAVVGRLAGVPYCLHGEHGWDIFDPDGTNPKYRRFRRVANPFVGRFITVSANLQKWLIESVGIPARKVTRICNGVDTDRFCPRKDGPGDDDLERRCPPDGIVVGSVLRFQEIKDPMNLVDAFIVAHQRAVDTGTKLFLAMIGDGPLREEAVSRLQIAGLANASWLPGSRDDIPDVMRSFDLFVLGSKREGISNTILEAMATGVPIIATNTGGNSELVHPKKNGELVAPEDSGALADKILRYAQDRPLREAAGASSRQLAVEEFSLDVMIDKYGQIYRGAIAVRGSN